MKSFEYYISKLKSFFDENDKFIIFTVFISSIINYIYLLTHNCLSHDGLFNGPIYIARWWEFDLGRPLISFVDKIRGGLVAPSIIFAIGIVFICASIIVVKKMFNINKKTLLFFISVLFVVFPTIADNALYIYCFDSYCISIFLATLGAYLVVKKRYLLSLLAISFSLPFYQAYVSFTVSLIVVYFVLQLLDDKKCIRDFIKCLLIVFFAIILYYVGLRISMIFFHRTLADYKGANGVGLGLLFDIPTNILDCYKDFYIFLFGNDIILNMYYKRNVLNFIIVILMSLTLIFNFFKNKNSNFVFIILLVLFFLPISICMMDMISSETNIITMTALGFLSFYLLAMLLIDRYLSFNFFKNIFYIVLCLLIFSLFLSDNAEFMARQDVYNNFYNRAQIALNKAVMLNDYDDNMKWMFNRVYIYESSLSKLSLGFASRQYETFDAYVGLNGIKIFYERYFGKKIELVDYDTYKIILETDEFKKMKIDSVKIINDVVVVKTSEFSY